MYFHFFILIVALFRLAQGYNTGTSWRNRNAFAALKNDGSIISFGDAKHGGSVPDSKVPSLINVTAVYSTKKTFAALKNNGQVIAWGHKDFGGSIPEDFQRTL